MRRVSSPCLRNHTAEHSPQKEDKSNNFDSFGSFFDSLNDFSYIEAMHNYNRKPKERIL